MLTPLSQMFSGNRAVANGEDLSTFRKYQIPYHATKRLELFPSLRCLKHLKSWIFPLTF